jgi:hypothetical protein
MRTLCMKIYHAEGIMHRTMVANDSKRLERVLLGMRCLSKGRRTQQKGRYSTMTTSKITSI